MIRFSSESSPPSLRVDLWWTSRSTSRPEFKKISVEANRVQADMVFRAKDGEGEMPMQYKLIREDGN